MHHYADRSLQPGALIGAWTEGLTHPTAPKDGAGEEGSLSKREREVLRLVAAGKSNNEVAAELGIRPNTVKNHLARMYDEANVNNRTELARWALSRGLV